MRTRRITKLILWLTATILFPLGCANDMNAEDAVNSEFTLWCGDNPCAWTVEEGEVAPAPTWHRSAKGIGFNSDPTRISQVVPLDDVECIIIATLGELEGNARFYWGMDFGNDGPSDGDGEIEIPFDNWETIHRETAVPAGTTEVRLILEKRGPGRAVLASAHFAGDYYCSSNP